MTANAPPASSTQTRTSIHPGSLVGGRFEVEQAASEDALGTIWAARDQKSGKRIALRLLSGTLIPSPDAAQMLRQECSLAAKLTHRTLAATYGVGSDASGSEFVACEWVDGVTLSTLIERRRQQQRALSLRGAYNVIAHLGNALTYVHEHGTTHGALRPNIVWVTRSGRVKLGDLGVTRTIICSVGAAALGPAEQPYLAPEVKAGGTPDARSDIFGLGALFYEMLTARSPAEGFLPPSQAHPEATAEIDQILLKCLAADPGQRYGSPDEVRRVLLPLMAGAASVSGQEEFGVDIDVDVDLASLPPPGAGGAGKAGTASRSQQGAAPQPAQAPAAQPGPAAQAAAAPGSPQGGGAPFEAVAPQQPQPAAQQASPQVAEAPPEPEKDLQTLLQEITENDAPRWMVVKDNLDHGPFSGRELVELILKGEMQEDHTVLNMDTGERAPMQEWAEFAEFLEQYKIKKRHEEHQAAIARTEKVEKRSNLFKALVAVAVVGVLGAGGGLFLLTRQDAPERKTAPDGKLADLYKRGDIEVEGSAGILPEPEPRARGGGGGGGHHGSGGGGGGGRSYREAMNEAVQMNAAKQGGQRQLDSQTVAGVMNKHVNQFFGCVSRELRRGGSLSKVEIDLAIAGSGKVMGATVKQGSSKFKSCVARKVRRVRFPSFAAPRMGARYHFSVN